MSVFNRGRDAQPLVGPHIIELVVSLAIYFVGRHFWHWDFVAYAATYAYFNLMVHRNRTGHDRNGV